MVDLTLALACSRRERRLALGRSQQTLAKKMGSSQSRVAKMELGVAGVTIDLLIRGLLATGCSLEEVGQIVAKPSGNHGHSATFPRRLNLTMVK
jgi:transcriptional regulator with XRE-family HTH domain